MHDPLKTGLIQFSVSSRDGLEIQCRSKTHACKVSG